MNILFLLTPKAKLAYLDEGMSIRQALEKMRAHGYTMIPMIEEESGKFIGNLSVADLLWNMVDGDVVRLQELENEKAVHLIRSSMRRAVNIDARVEDILPLLLQGNYVPVVDDRGVLMGIITRKSVLEAYLNSAKLPE